MTEQHFRAIFESAAIGITLADLDGQLLAANRAHQQIVGQGADEVRGSHFVDGTHPEDRAAEQALFGELVQGKRDHYELEKRYSRKDGSAVWVSLKASLVRDGEERPQFIIGMIEDITERKRLGEQLRQAQKMEAVGRLAGGLAHDFNNMLAAITGYSDLLLDKYATDETPRGFLREIMKAAERASSLARQLLMFSRRQVLTPQVIGPGDLVANMHKMLRCLIGEDIELVTVPDAGAGRIKADPGQVEQVVLNLAVNARDAMPRGGKLTIAVKNVDLDEQDARRLGDAPPGSYVMLAVSDTGCGMSEQVRSHLFEPFFTTKDPSKGTGLGLAIVYGIVQQSGGHIEVDSAPDQGAVFRIYLPRVAEPARAPAIKPSERPAPGSETILLVEDEPMVRGLVSEVLRLSGYTVLEAMQGDEALRLCEQHAGQIDLMLTDVVMPGMNGRELVERAADVRPAMKVLLMSGYTDHDVIRDGALHAGGGFIQKPFTPAGLTRKVREVLSP